MNRFFAMFAYGFFIYVPIALAYRLREDFSHPERWGNDPQYDPRIYLPVLALTAVFVVAAVLYACFRSYRQDIHLRELRERIQRIIGNKQGEDE